MSNLSIFQKQIITIALAKCIITAKIQKRDTNEQKYVSIDDKFCELLHCASLSKDANNIYRKSLCLTLYEVATTINITDKSTEHQKLLFCLQDCSADELNKYKLHIVNKLTIVLKKSTDMFFEKYLSNWSSIMTIVANNTPDKTQACKITSFLQMKKLHVDCLFGVMLTLSEGDLLLRRDAIVMERLGHLCFLLRRTLKNILLYSDKQVESVSDCSLSAEEVEEVRQFALVFEEWAIQSIAGVVDRDRRKMPLLAAGLMRIVADLHEREMDSL